MDEPTEFPRNSKRGVVLIATLISLMFLMGMVISLQTSSLAATKVLSRLAQSTEDNITRDSLRELARPLLSDSMIHFDDSTKLQLNGVPFSFSYKGQTYQIVAQDLDGLIDLWRTPLPTANVLLSQSQMAQRNAMVAVGSPQMPLRQIVSILGYQEVPLWLTDRASKRQPNRPTLYFEFLDNDLSSLIRRLGHSQPKASRVFIFNQ